MRSPADPEIELSGPELDERLVIGAVKSSPNFSPVVEVVTTTARVYKHAYGESPKADRKRAALEQLNAKDVF